jgi:hypothetical protein
VFEAYANVAEDVAGSLKLYVLRRRQSEMRWRYPLISIALAVAVFAAGLAHGLVMVGVPTQDPTPAIATAEARNASISGWGMFAGACLFIMSVVWLAVVAIARFIWRPAVA